jgi:hypothetical protein
MVRALEAGNKELYSQMVKDFLLGDEQRDEQNEKLSAMWTRNNNHHRFNKSRPAYHKNEEDGNQSYNKLIARAVNRLLCKSLFNNYVQHPFINRLKLLNC